VVRARRGERERERCLVFNLKQVEDVILTRLSVLVF
jgi:hypothetical protein